MLEFQNREGPEEFVSIYTYYRLQHARNISKSGIQLLDQPGNITQVHLGKQCGETGDWRVNY